MLDMNENQKFDPKITATHEMQDFIATADEQIEGLPEAIDQGNEMPARIGVEVPQGQSVPEITPAYSDEDVQRGKRVGTAAAVAAGVAATAGLALLSGGNAEPVQDAPNPTAPAEDVAINSEGEMVQIADPNYADLPSDPRQAEITIGGDSDGDGYVDRVDVALNESGVQDGQATTDMDPSTPDSQVENLQK